MVSTIASVEPMVTTISVSGAYFMPMKRSHLRESAWRKFGAPIVMGYWCGPSWLTSSSRSVIALGGSKSGKPCARLIAPQSMLMRVIRRMTESVKCSFLLLSSCMVSLLPFSFVRVGRACVLPARALFIIAKL